MKEFYKNTWEQVVDLEIVQIECLTFFENEMDNRQNLESLVLFKITHSNQ